MKLNKTKKSPKSEKINQEVKELEKKEAAVRKKEAVKMRPTMRMVLLSVTAFLSIGVVLGGFFLVRQLLIDERYSKTVGVFESQGESEGYEFDYDIDPNKKPEGNSSEAVGGDNSEPGDAVNGSVGGNDGTSEKPDKSSGNSANGTPTPNWNYIPTGSSSGKTTLPNGTDNGDTNGGDGELTGNAMDDGDNDGLSNSKDKLNIDEEPDYSEPDANADNDDYYDPNNPDNSNNPGNPDNPNNPSNPNTPDNPINPDGEYDNPEWPENPADWNDDGNDDSDYSDDVNLADYLDRLDESNMQQGINPDDITPIDPELWLH